MYTAHIFFSPAVCGRCHGKSRQKAQGLQVARQVNKGDEVSERGIYATLLGPDFERLATPLKRFHLEGGERRGTFQITGGPTAWHRRWARLMRLPAPEAEVGVVLHLRLTPEGEIWTRTFGDHRLVTTQRLRRGRLEERAGPLTFVFSVTVEHDAMLFRQVGCRLVGLPMPSGLSPKVNAHVQGLHDGWNVDVTVLLPLVGVVTRYWGKIEGS